MPEPFEDLVQVVCGDAVAGVSDRDGEPDAGSPDADAFALPASPAATASRTAGG